jgi:hypothetical protein
VTHTISDHTQETETMPRPDRLTVEDIAQWIANDEGLYTWHKRSRTPIRKFIRENRAELEACIRNVTEGRKPAHYLTYGPH